MHFFKWQYNSKDKKMCNDKKDETSFIYVPYHWSFKISYVTIWEQKKIFLVKKKL